MKEPLDPELNFDRIPAFWAAAVVISVGLVGNFVLGRPQLLGHGAVLAGLISSFGSGYYQNSGNSAMVGTLLGTILISPLLAYSRTTFVYNIQGTGDTLFISAIITLAWLIIVVMILLPLAYIGALIGDVVRKRVGGPLGY